MGGSDLTDWLFENVRESWGPKKNGVDYGKKPWGYAAGPGSRHLAERHATKNKYRLRKGLLRFHSREKSN